MFVYIMSAINKIKRPIFFFNSYLNTIKLIKSKISCKEKRRGKKHLHFYSRKPHRNRRAIYGIQNETNRQIEEDFRDSPQSVALNMNIKLITMQLLIWFLNNFTLWGNSHFISYELNSLIIMIYIAGFEFEVTLFHMNWAA